MSNLFCCIKGAVYEPVDFAGDGQQGKQEAREILHEQNIDGEGHENPGSHVAEVKDKEEFRLQARQATCDGGHSVQIYRVEEKGQHGSASSGRFQLLSGGTQFGE